MAAKCSNSLISNLVSSGVDLSGIAAKITSILDFEKASAGQLRMMLQPFGVTPLTGLDIFDSFSSTYMLVRRDSLIFNQL